MDRAALAGKRLLVMGLGRFGGGVDVVRFAVTAGAHVVVTDRATPVQLRDAVEQLRGLADVEFHLGRHDPDDFLAADVVVASPAVRPDNELLQLARRRGKPVASQIGLFFQMCPAMIVGITGANGKSTTAALTAHLLGEARPQAGGLAYGRVWLSGNIGHRPLLASLDDIGAGDVVVLELSSFQLEQLTEIRAAPQVALLTNLTPNHLDRHGTFEAYCAAKENIFKLQHVDAESPAISIFNAEDSVGSQWLEKYREQPGRICIGFSADDVGAAMREGFPLLGRANLSNLAAAMAIARQFGTEDRAVAEALPSFKALAHRLEWVGTVNGVRWYNDSVATTPQSALVALEAFEEPKIIIAGGYDKDLPFDALGAEIACRAKAAILIGQTAGKIADAIRANASGDSSVRVAFAGSLEQAVSLAHQFAVAGDVVLLSPACASYDMFDNFQHRGQVFVELVRELGAGL